MPCELLACRLKEPLLKKTTWAKDVENAPISARSSF
jgi:hypothetical protein